MKINELPTPCYVIDENIIEENCKVLADVMKKNRLSCTSDTESVFQLCLVSADWKVFIRNNCQRTL